MKIANHEVLTRYRDALLARFPDQLQRLILFGSQARGDATAGSDIDVMVKEKCLARTHSLVQKEQHPVQVGKVNKRQNKAADFRAQSAASSFT